MIPVASRAACPSPLDTYLGRTRSARRRYAAVFGWHYDEVADTPGYTTFAIEDLPLGGLGGQQAGYVKEWTTCFCVGSADAAERTATAAGGRTTLPPMDNAVGRIAMLADPWGAPFSVMQELPG